MKLKGAQIIVETLIEQGASTVFGYPGGQVIDIYDALYLAQDRIHHIITHMQQTVMHVPPARSALSSPPPVRVPPIWSPVSPLHIWTLCRW